MKRLPLIIIALLLADLAAAQEAKPAELTIGEEGLYQYQEVLEAPGTADELYDRAMTWVALRYNSANDVVQLRDKENHRIIVKGNWQQAAYLGMATLFIHHTLQVETRDGRYRVSYGSFLVENAGSPGVLTAFESNMAGGKGIRRKAGDRVRDMIADLHTAMQEQSTEDEW